MWELYQHTISPIISMGGVYWDINQQKFDFRTRNIDNDDLDDIMDHLELINGMYNANSNDTQVYFEEKDIHALDTLNKDYENADEQLPE
jgi:hypothetical protein